MPPPLIFLFSGKPLPLICRVEGLMLTETRGRAVVEQAERELAEVKGLVDEQYGLVMRLKRIGADTHEAVRLLIDLLELQQTREQRLAQARIHLRQLSPAAPHRAPHV
jgi:hypothetical protein